MPVTERQRFTGSPIQAARFATVPPLLGWKDAAVPPRLATAQVQALLDSCDRATTTGVRDYAMLELLARLGLRAAEVAALSSDDVRWRAGEVVVRRREGRLPLTADVGDAVTRYLLQGRPDNDREEEHGPVNLLSDSQWRY